MKPLCGLAAKLYYQFIIIQMKEYLCRLTTNLHTWFVILKVLYVTNPVNEGMSHV